MRINAIKTTKDGIKLIAYSRECSQYKSKPIQSTVSFAEFIPANNSVIFYYGNTWEQKYFKSYKAALKYIFSL